MRDKNYLRMLIDYNAWANAETYRLVFDMPPAEVTKKRKSLLESIFVSLNHLLNGRQDLAIDTFVEAMAVDNDTVDTHLALGSLVRRRSTT